MAEKTLQVHALEPASDEETAEPAALAEKDAKRKRTVRLAMYIGAFAVFQVAVILVFVMVVMRVHAPKLHVGRVRVESLITFGGSTSSSPSFNITFAAAVRVKNPNFGPYKYDTAAVLFTYAGAMVGQAVIPKGKAGFMATKKVELAVTVSSSNLTAVASADSDLGSKLSSGTVTLRSQGTVTGKVAMMLVFKKRKSGFMDCVIVFNVSSRAVQSLACH